MRVKTRHLYYLCSRSNVDSILSNGLIIGLTNPEGAKGHLSAIYLTNDWTKIANDPDFYGRDLALLQVDATEIPLIRDDNYEQSEGSEYAWYTTQSIEPSRLTFIGNVSGNKLIKLT